MKSLKDFINQNREQFDTHEPNANTWNEIEAGLGVKKQTGIWNNVLVWRAAAAIFFAATSYLWITGGGLNTRREAAQIQNEFQDLESFYSSQIAEKVSLISGLNEEDDTYAQDIQKLEAMYLVLREQMKTQPSQKVKDALILNLLVRIDLLNQQLKKLEDEKKADKPVEESV